MPKRFSGSVRFLKIFPHRETWERPRYAPESTALPSDRQVDFWTVQTYLRRLKTKGYLKARHVGQGNVYSAAVEPKKVIRELTDDFLDRLFSGEAMPLCQQLVDARRLSQQDIDALQRRLDELKKGNK